MQVMTKNGPLARELLQAKDVITEEGNARIVATEWFLGDEMVRRDVAVSMLMPLDLGTQQGAVNG